MSYNVHPGDIVWMVTCDHGFPKPDTIVQLKVVSTGRKYFCLSLIHILLGLKKVQKLF